MENILLRDVTVTTRQAYLKLRPALCVSGYELYRNDRDRHSGGVCMYIFKMLALLKNICSIVYRLESLLVLVEFIPGVSLVVGTLYR